MPPLCLCPKRVTHVLFIYSNATPAAIVIYESADVNWNIKWVSYQVLGACVHIRIIKFECVTLWAPSQYKDSFSNYGDFHNKDKMVVSL